MPLVTARDLFTDSDLRCKLARFYALKFEFSNDQLIEFEEYDFELIQIRMHTVSEYIFYSKGLSEEEIKSDPLNYPHHCVKIKL